MSNGGFIKEKTHLGGYPEMGLLAEPLASLIEQRRRRPLLREAPPTLAVETGMGMGFRANTIHDGLEYPRGPR